MAENYISTNMNTGVDVKTALERIEAYQPDLFVWTEISDSVTVNLKSPTTYSGIKDPGDYVIYKFSNGPSAIPSTLSPILLSLRNGVICVTANNMVFKYDSNSGTWKDINEDVEDSTVIYIKDNAAPTRTKNTFWFDTSKFDGTKNGYIDLKYYNETTKSWESVFDSAAYLKKSKLDPDNKQLDIFDYIDDKVADAVGDYGDFMKHVDNKLTLIHVSAEDRANYAKIITAAELQNLINTTYKTAVKSAIDTSVNTELDTSTLEKNVSSLESDFSNHLKNHVTAAQITAWSNKAEANHTHDYTTGTTKISASQIVGGTFAADKLPDEIKERYYAGSTKVTDLSTTTVGSTFKFGKYQVESETPWAIEWEIVHQTEDYQIAQTKQIIDLRAFDAKESTNTDSGRSKYGNNNWQYSNIKQFLNSDQATWYSAQHQYDAPPNSSNVWQYSNGTTYNAYDTHKGFLYYFSDEEKNLLKDMTLTLANPTVDGGGSYTWTGKVWLPTYTQMSGNQNNSISEGTKFDKYSDDNSRSKTLHDNCIANNEYCKINNYSSGKAHWYWMSSANPSDSCGTRCVHSDGVPESGIRAFDGGYGLAPCICLPRTGTLTSTPSPEEEFSNTSITDADRATKYHNGNAFYYPTTDAYGNLTYRWFRIIDSTKVGTADWASGVTEFTATESVLDWNSISGRPTTLEGFGITETLYTKSQVDEKFSASKEKATELSKKVEELDGNSEYEFEGVGGVANVSDSNSYPNSVFNFWKLFKSIPDYPYFIGCYGNGKFVVIGSNSWVGAYSTDGLNWNSLSLPNGYWRSICYGNGKFVAVAPNGLFGAYSTDGIIWHESTMEFSNQWYSVCYGNGKFVAVAQNSNIAAYSTDGINWTQSELPSSQYWYSVCYGNDKFVVTSAYSDSFAYSSDGINWTAGTMPSRTNQISVCYGGGKFVAISNSSSVVTYSTDGITWTDSSMSRSAAWNSVCYADGLFIATTYQSTVFNYSTDGITWTESGYSAVDNSADLNLLFTDDNGNIYNIGEYGSNKFSMSSSTYISSLYKYNKDSIRFEEVKDSNSLYAENYTAMCYGNGKFVAVSASNSDIAAYSTDGINWAKSTLPIRGYYLDICYGNGKFVSISGSTVAYSTDGITWKSASCPSGGGWNSICYGNGKFVAVSSNNSLNGGWNKSIYSTDGINWTETDMPSTQTWNDVYYGGNKFIAVAWSTTEYAYSSDGINWTAGTMPSKDVWYSICYINNKFIVVGFHNLAISSDGINWTIIVSFDDTLGYSLGWPELFYTGSMFIIIDQYNNKSAYDILVSTDCINWGYSGYIDKQFKCACYGDGKFVICDHES